MNISLLYNIIVNIIIDWVLRGNIALCLVGEPTPVFILIKNLIKNSIKYTNIKKMLNNKYIPGSQTLLLIYPMILNNKID